MTCSSFVVDPGGSRPSNISCAGGKGVCNVEENVCVCLNGAFSDASDFRRSTGCSVHVGTWYSMWIITLITFMANIVLGFAAIALMRRKKITTSKNELVGNISFVVVSILAVATCILELNGNARIGIDPVLSIVFALLNFSSYTASLARPAFKSETSISRFVLERVNGKLLKTYMRLMMGSSMLLLVTSLTPVVSAYYPEQERAMVFIYLVLQTILAGIFCVFIGITATKVSQDFERAMSHPAVSARSSLRARVVMFTRRAKRTIATSFLILIGIASATLVAASCEECLDRSLWFLIPFFFTLQSLNILRALRMSIQTSFKYRRFSNPLIRGLNHHHHDAQSDHDNYDETRHGQVNDHNNNHHHVSKSASSPEPRSYRPDDDEVMKQTQTRVRSKRFMSTQKKESNNSFVVVGDDGLNESGPTPTTRGNSVSATTSSISASNPLFLGGKLSSSASTSPTVSQPTTPSAAFPSWSSSKQPDRERRAATISFYGRRTKMKDAQKQFMSNTTGRMFSLKHRIMSAVQEVEYEGTVIMTNVDTEAVMVHTNNINRSSRFESSRVASSNDRHMDGDDDDEGLIRPRLQDDDDNEETMKKHWPPFVRKLRHLDTLDSESLNSSSMSSATNKLAASSSVSSSSSFFKDSLPASFPSDRPHLLSGDSSLSSPRMWQHNVYEEDDNANTFVDY